MLNKPERTEKPWGFEILFAHTDKYAGKLLFIKKGHQTSLQFHEHKLETMYILEGMIDLTKGQNVLLAGNGAYPINIEPNTIHRVKARIDTLILEVSTPELDDVVRIEDDYGRSRA